MCILVSYCVTTIDKHEYMVGYEWIMQSMLKNIFKMAMYKQWRKIPNANKYLTRFVQ
jgi:hypothetical protein